MRTCTRTHVWRFAFATTLSALANAAPESTPAAGTPAAAGVATPRGEPTVTEAAPKQKTPAPKPRPRLSAEITAQLTARLPVWSPPPPEKKDAAPPPPADPDVVQMKPVIVRGDRLPRVEEKEWLTPKARAGVLTKEYLSDFDRSFLNRFTLPLFGISKEARAQMMYEENKRLQDLHWMNDQVEQLQKLDPAEAKAMEAIRDATFTRTNP